MFVKWTTIIISKNRFLMGLPVVYSVIVYYKGIFIHLRLASLIVKGNILFKRDLNFYFRDI